MVYLLPQYKYKIKYLEIRKLHIWYLIPGYYLNEFLHVLTIVFSFDDFKLCFNRKQWHLQKGSVPLTRTEARILIKFTPYLRFHLVKKQRQKMNDVAIPRSLQLEECKSARKPELLPPNTLTKWLTYCLSMGKQLAQVAVRSVWWRAGPESLGTHACWGP